MRGVYIDLATEKNTPTDILKSKFDAVEESEQTYLMVTADVDISYSCTVGYDKQQTYYEDGKRKTKTVTDWRPHSGTYHSEETVFGGNTEEAAAFSSDSGVRLCIRTTHKDKFEKVEVSSVEANSSAIMQAKSDCITSCFYGVKLPGDRQKDSDYSGAAEVKDIQGVILPTYTVRYEYMGKEYEAKGFACGDVAKKVDSPSISGEVDSEAESKTKKFKTVALVAFILGIVCNVASGFDGLSILMDLCWIPYIVAVGLIITYFVVKVKVSNSIYEVRQEEKKNALISLLKNKGYAELTEKELERFKTKQ